MARSLRVEYEDAVYHVTARGNERRRTYHCDAERALFLRTLGECAVLTASTCTPLAGGRRAVGLLPKGELCVIRGHAHCAHYTAPEEVAAAILAHAAGQAA